MTAFVPASDIERLVGVERSETDHYARADSAEQTVYILHSQVCKDLEMDLRDCPFSKALDEGIDEADWEGFMDRAVVVAISEYWLLVPRSASPGEGEQPA